MVVFVGPSTWSHSVCPLLPGTIFTVAVKVIPGTSATGAHVVDAVGLIVPKFSICSFAVVVHDVTGRLTCQAFGVDTIVAVGPLTLKVALAIRLQLRPFAISSAESPGMSMQY